ncbi:MAG: NifU family protein [Tissierellia bacterium]|jgi:Fe-S cluster biogenesis protein NfuA|nr:NifU family protein [Tissierellia bacterium]
MKSDIEGILNKYIRPTLMQDGGNIKLLESNKDTIKLKLMGQCSNCPLSSHTTEYFIKTVLTEKLPEIKNITVETGLSEELLDIAYKYLRRDE